MIYWHCLLHISPEKKEEWKEKWKERKKKEERERSDRWQVCFFLNHFLDYFVISICPLWKFRFLVKERLKKSGFYLNQVAGLPEGIVIFQSFNICHPCNSWKSLPSSWLSTYHSSITPLSRNLSICDYSFVELSSVTLKSLFRLCHAILRDCLLCLLFSPNLSP